MTGPSSGIGWLQVVLLVLLPFCFGVLDSSQNESPSNDICTEKDKPNFKLPLLGAMIFPENILLIDGHFRMYEVPRSNYEGSYGQMTLNIKGVPMERYWPALAEVAQDDCFRQTYKTIYHLIFNKTGNVKVMFDVFLGSCAVYGWCYALKTQSLCSNPDSVVDDIGEYLQYYIDSGVKIYSIEGYQVGEVTTKKGAEVITVPKMAVWDFVYDGETVKNGNSTEPALMYYLVADKKDTNTQKSVAVYKAKNFEQKLDDPPAGFHRENITDWNLSKDYLPVGYLFNGSFYLYALDRVVIFEDRMPGYEEINKEARWGQLLARSEVTVVMMSEYFQCDTADRNVTVPPEPEPGNHTGGNSARFSSSSAQSSSLLKVVIIASVVVFLLLIFAVAAIIFCCCFDGKEKKSKEKKSKQGSKASKALEKASKSSVAGGSQVNKVGGSKMTMVSKQGSAVVDDKKLKAAGTSQMSKVAPKGNLEKKKKKK